MLRLNNKHDYVFRHRKHLAKVMLSYYKFMKLYRFKFLEEHRDIKYNLLSIRKLYASAQEDILPDIQKIEWPSC